jgi:type IV pilus assembly protein PilA
MYHAPHRRVFLSGFSLIEILVTVSLIGIVTALLIPNLLQARQEALRQTARQQAKNLEKAMANWYANQDTLRLASTNWDTYANAAGYIVNAAFLTDANMLAPYLPDSGVKFTPDPGGSGAITTPEMLQIPTQGTAGFIGGADPVTGATTGVAHCLLYWDPTKRTQVSPKVIFLLPNIP